MFLTMQLVELRSVSVQKAGNVSKAILKNKHMKSKNLEKTQNVNFPLLWIPDRLCLFSCNIVSRICVSN